MNKHSITVRERFENGGVKVVVNGVCLTLSRTGRKLRVSWASDWEALFGLKNDGLLTREFDRDTWGHQEFFATPELLKLLVAEVLLGRG